MCFVKVKRGENGLQYFKRFYICFDAIKREFKAGYRQILGFDGCFLKSPCKRLLLICVLKNGNNQMSSISWGVVDIKNNKTGSSLSLP